MIEIIDNRLLIDNKRIPKGDTDILKILIRQGPSSVHRISELKGQIYDQYTSSRLRFLTSPILSNIVVKNNDGLYEINPEIKDELENALKGLK